MKWINQYGNMDPINRKAKVIGCRISTCCRINIEYFNEKYIYISICNISGSNANPHNKCLFYKYTDCKLLNELKTQTP